MYKIYVGDYVKKGVPNTWTLVHSSEHLSVEDIKEIVINLKYGMDLYIVKENKIIARYYGGKNVRK